ncbi:hypothetical protein LOC68_08170 [Blastopirellula sp. JC732]|uniref:Uncharacterized protein n=1 Tax=Blastopirellula sediminis TaxID=2894196 RepID=A0A9X1ML86_9BACT|nr:cytochrome c3 family protein [Blastopirellula sediminis]MCC9608856.1 hypothetical protein [Blastopirellula sediminis]MCC9628367.1 hypothetical protein [Blastopirellula sediminis]
MPSRLSIFRRIPLVAIPFLVALLLGGLALADWYWAIPTTRQATFVGRNSCIECHQAEHKDFMGSFHDKAMDLATEETVLGDFNDAEFTHFDITSKMFRKDGKYFINTEGPDGKLADFEVKYVFGVDPLQQYMVEIEPPTPGSPAGSIGRVQVLRISWDTNKKEWFYLPPPDVDEKLEPNDPLHWTGAAQNWNHMCADCHSTNLHKNFDLASNSYHTTFTEIDVSCEACHGPGSLHVELANSYSLFWDRNHGYGLKQLKGESNVAQVQACADCHSRRRVVCPTYQRGDSYYDQYSNELIMPQTYYCDGQILDEDYVFGSFLQSKMYHKNIRCTDCHNPHSTKVKFEGNKLCTSCHQHPAGKYDTEAHYRHKADGTGSSCVECHMPETTYMEVDPRRDHSIRVPRPDLSVALQTPNACTKCHLDRAKVSDEKRASLKNYGDWMTAARNGDEEVAKALAEVDAWAAKAVKEWYGRDYSEEEPSFAYTLSQAWNEDPHSFPKLIDLARDRQQPPIVRASAVTQLSAYADQPETGRAIKLALVDSDPQLRSAAMIVTEFLSPSVVPHPEALKLMMAGLDDPTRLVRTDAANALAGTPIEFLKLNGKAGAFEKALGELKESLLRNADQAGALLALGALSERMGDDAGAEKYYRDAVRIQPNVTGPRSNLAELLTRKMAPQRQRFEQLAASGQRDQARQMVEELAIREFEIAHLREEELVNLARDAEQLPNVAQVQYRFGLALYQANQLSASEEAIARATELQPNSTTFLTALVRLQQKREKWEEAKKTIATLRQLRPNDPGLAEVEQEILQRRQPDDQR